METPRKWYQTELGIIALLLFFFPVGLYLMWKYSFWTKKTRTYITVILAILVFGALVSNVVSLGMSVEEDNNESKVATESSVQERQNQEQKPEEKETTKYKEERKEALQLVWDYRLQKDLSYPPTEKGTTLVRAFAMAEQDKVLVFDPGWLAVKEGDRIVVGWLGTRAGSIHYPEWEVRDNKISVLNGSAKTYTPELATENGDRGRILSLEEIEKLIEEQGSLD